MPDSVPSLTLTLSSLNISSALAGPGLFCHFENCGDPLDIPSSWDHHSRDCVSTTLHPVLSAIHLFPKPLSLFVSDLFFSLPSYEKPPLGKSYNSPALKIPHFLKLLPWVYGPEPGADGPVLPANMDLCPSTCGRTQSS